MKTRAVLLVLVSLACVERDAVQPSLGNQDLIVDDLTVLSDENGQPVSSNAVIGINSNGNGTTLTTGFGTISVHGHDGRTVKHIFALGRKPGQFGSAWWLMTVADTMFVYDSNMKRVTALGPDGELVRYVDIGASVLHFLPLSDGRLVINTDDAAAPLRVVDRNGSVAASFGNDSTIANSRSLAPADTASFWAASTYQYVLEKWSDTGEKLQTIRRNAEWFPGSNGPVSFGRKSPPAPKIVGIAVRGGEILVMIRIVDVRWSEAVVEKKNVGTLIEDWDRAYDTVIEVLDAADGRVLHSARFDQAYQRILSDGRLSGRRTVADDLMHITIHGVRNVR